MNISTQTALKSIPYLSQRLREALEQDALKSAYIEELLAENAELKEAPDNLKADDEADPSAAEAASRAT